LRGGIISPTNAIEPKFNIILLIEDHKKLADTIPSLKTAGIQFYINTIAKEAALIGNKQ